MSQPRTHRELFGFIALCLAVGYVILWRAEIFGWLLSLPPIVFAWLLAFGAAISLGALIVGMDALVEWFAIRNARKQGARHV